MNDDEIAEYFKYSSPKSILVVTWYGRLKELNCPFGVKVKNAVGNLKFREYHKVEKVLMSSSGKTVFVIDSAAYYYNYFDILTHI